MRLFIAIILEEEIKDSLVQTVGRLKGLAKAGTFTDKENLHITVNFIGETKRLTEVKEAMSRVLGKPDATQFTLSIDGFGRFKRDDGDIYWIGVEKDQVLWMIQQELVKELKEAGFFDIDDRDYKPHLTLGRRIKIDKNFDSKAFGESIQPMQMRVSKISLMKSERIEGKLTYTEVFGLGLR